MTEFINITPVQNLSKKDKDVKTTGFAQAVKKIYDEDDIQYLLISAEGINFIDLAGSERTKMSTG